MAVEEQKELSSGLDRQSIEEEEIEDSWPLRRSRPLAIERHNEWLWKLHHLVPQMQGVWFQTWNIWFGDRGLHFDRMRSLDLIQLNLESVNHLSYWNAISIFIDETNVLLWNCVKIDEVRSTMNNCGFRFLMWWNGDRHARLTL